MLTVPLLSHRSVGLLLSFSNSDCSECSQAVSCAAWLRAIYSASVVDNATVRCFLDVHAIAAPEWHTTHPEMDRRSTICHCTILIPRHQWALLRSFILKRSHNAIFNSFFDDSLFERRSSTYTPTARNISFFRRK
ncbi:hypothetical protein T03_1556 [Trichinella britovi]|uniref:Uncharacterized protein n=1 Tax=Trichinella britovi TaxID=45882 RepID=A0A0V1AKU0_TRIBR|nr:hypothetical protein T03_1556 [Trichinella britovi]